MTTAFSSAASSGISKTNFGRKIAGARKLYEFCYNLTRSVKPGMVLLNGPFITLFFCIQCVVINFDYHHPYTEGMEWVLRILQVFADPFFWVTNYLGVYLFVVVIGVWFFLLYELYGIYCYVTSGLSDYYYSYLALQSKLLMTVFFIPLISIFFKSFRCKFFDGSFELFEFSGGDHLHNCLEFPYLAVMIICAIVIVVSGLVLIPMALVLPDRLYTTSAINATPSGRWHAVWLFGVLLIYCSKIFLSADDGYIRLVAPACGLVVNLLLFVILLVWFPFYWKITNFVVGLVFSLSISGNISGIVSEIISENESSELFEDIFHPSFLVVMMIVCGVISTVLLSVRLLVFYWGLFIFKSKSRNYRLTKLALRLMGVEQLGLFLAYCTTRELEKLDLELDSIYGKSVSARIFFILRCFEKKSFDPVRLKSIVRKLMMSQSVQERVPLDFSFYLYSIGERMVEMDFGDNSKKMIIKQISRASKYESVVRKSLKKIFGCYLNEGIKIKTLGSLFNELDENDYACHMVYKRVLKKNADNALVLRRYGKYLLEIRLDPLKADSYLRQSMALEKNVYSAKDQDMDLDDDISEYSSSSSVSLALSSKRQIVGEPRSPPQPQPPRDSNNESRISFSSNPSSIPSTKFNNYLEPNSVGDEGSDLSSQKSVSKNTPDFSQSAISNKKKLATRLSRENLCSTSFLCCCIFMLFVTSALMLCAIFTIGMISWGIAGTSQFQIFKMNDLSVCTVKIGTAASQISSSVDMADIQEHRAEMQHQCEEMDRLSKEVYDEMSHEELFRKKYMIKGSTKELALIDALGVWRKHCELFLANWDYHSRNYNNDTSTIFLYENSEYMADILREVVDEYVTEVNDSVNEILMVMWIMEVIALLTYPLIFPVIVYFCILERSLLKLLLVIPKNAVYDAFANFGGTQSSADGSSDAKSIRSHGNMGTLSKLCIYMCGTFVLVFVMSVILCITTEIAGSQFFSFLRKESVTSQYMEKMNIVYFYLNDFRNPYNHYFAKNESLSRVLKNLDELDLINENLRFGTDDFTGSDDYKELHYLYYDAKCQTEDTASVSIENIICYSFNQRIDAHRMAVEIYIFGGLDYATRESFLWPLIEMIHTNSSLFEDLVEEIDEVQMEEFDEMISPAFAFLAGFFFSSIFILLFLYCCILCRYPGKVRRHLYRIRSAFLYLDNHHLLDNKLYRVLTNPPSILPWLTFSRVSKNFVSMKEKKTRSLMEGLPVYATVIFDKSKRIRFLNAEAKEMIGLPVKKMAYGLKFTNFFVDSSKLRAWMGSGESDTFTGEMAMNTIRWRENFNDIVRDDDGEQQPDGENKYDSVMKSVDIDDHEFYEDPEFKKNLDSKMNDKNSKLRKNMNKFHARVAVVRRKGRYLAVMKNIETEIHQKQLVEHEKKRSEDYLFNILPKKIAKSFFTSPETSTFVVHQEVSVVFQDMVGFTFYSSHTQPELVIAILNELFKGIDELCVKNKMEKIKTIGDAYLAACGVPEYVHDHAKWSFKFARECLQFLYQFNFQKERDFKVRSGIHTGKVVAGVIGKVKYQYDIWGDAVNTAARMEQTGIPNKIQVSRETYAYLYEDYKFEEREVFVKGKGNLKVYIHSVENTFIEEGMQTLQRDDNSDSGSSSNDDDQGGVVSQETIDDGEMRRRELELRNARFMNIVAPPKISDFSSSEEKKNSMEIVMPDQPVIQTVDFDDDEDTETEIIQTDAKSVVALSPRSINSKTMKNSKLPKIMKYVEEEGEDEKQEDDEKKKKFDKELERMRLEMEKQMYAKMEYERQQRENWLNREKQKLESKRKIIEEEREGLRKVKEEQARASPLVNTSRRNQFEVKLISGTPEGSLRGMKRSNFGSLSKDDVVPLKESTDDKNEEDDK